MNLSGPSKTQFWDTFFIIVVSTAFGLGLVGLGIVLGRKMSSGATPFPVAPQIPQLSGLGDSTVFGLTNAQEIGASPQKVVQRVKTGKRQVIISTDQPIRVSDSASVSSTSGMLIPGGMSPTTLPFLIGPSVELFTVRAGASNALASFTTRPVK